MGIVGHSAGQAVGSTVYVGAIANARTMSPWPPFNINYEFVVAVDAEGGVQVTGSHDGFPSYEIWAYRDGREPELVYSHNEGHVGELAGSRDVKVNR